jgi:ketosteroid isomerase-like protein
MATASSRLADPPTKGAMDTYLVSARNRRIIQAMVDCFAKQDIDNIMVLIAQDAVYCDIFGKGPRGNEYRGKDAIKKAFVRQFDLAGRHNDDNAKIMAEGDAAFASWVMVICNVVLSKPKLIRLF